MLVLLDRDGVINEDLPQGVTSWQEFRLLPGALTAIARLTQAGCRIAIVTNQSAVAKGLMTEEELGAIHAQLRAEVEKAGGAINAIYYCTDHPDAPTERRKPAPGMLREALRDFGALPQNTACVGDALRDLEAATAAGCPGILVKTGKGQFTLNNGLPDALQPIVVMDDLSAAAEYILTHFKKGASA